MPTSTRIKGKGLTLKLAGQDYAIDATSVLLEAEDSTDGLTFSEVTSGARNWKITVEAIQSTDNASFWSYLWTNAGSSSVAFIFSPWGNTSATSSQPIFSGTVQIPRKPDFGGVANENFSFTFELPVNGEPTLARA